MRGKAGKAGADGHGHGITPAHAGKSTDFGGTRQCTQDHPRACGEKFVGSCVKNSTTGSPPRMRGKVQRRLKNIGNARITPAHAGKRTFLHITAYLNWDHPRACGEKLCIIVHMQHITGSPPRMRGKETVLKTDDPSVRITPAHAGKSSVHSPATIIHKDHPRACGEKEICA